MNDVGDILDTLGDKWDSLTEVEQNALASATAGTKQRENFIVLMDNYKDAIKYTEEAMNSSGTAMEKYNAYLQSIEASQAKLKATFEEFSQTLVDKGIIKGFYDLASSGLQLLTLLTKFPLLLRTIISLLSVIAIQKMTKSLGKFKLGLGSTIEQIKIYIMSMKNAELRQIAVAEGLDVTATKAKLATIGWTAIIVAITALISYYSQLKKEQQETTRAMAEEIKNTSNSLEDLIKQYEDLGKDGSFNTEDLSKAQKIQEEITNLVGKQANNLNLVSSSYEEQLKLLKEIQVENAKKNTEALASASALEEELAEGTGTGWAGFKKAIFRMGEFYKNLYGTITNTNAFGELDALIGKAANKAKDSSKKYSKDILDILQRTEAVTNEIAVRPMAYSADQIKSFGEEIKQNLEILKQEGVISQEEYSNAIAKTNVGLQPYLDKLNSINKALKVQAENQLIIDMASRDINNQESYDDYIESIKNSAEYSDKFKEVLIEVVEQTFPQFSGALTKTEVKARQYANSISDLKKEIESAKTAYDVLTSAIEEYNEQGYLNYDTINNILEQGSDFIAYLVDEKGHIRDNTSALEKYIKEKTLLQAIETALSYVNSFSNKTQEEALDILKNKISSQQTAIQSNLDFLGTEIQLLPYTKEVKEQIWQQAIGYLKLVDNMNLSNSSIENTKDATEDWEKVLAYANKILDDHIEKLEKEREAIEKEREAIEKSIEEQIKAKKKQIDLLEKEKEALEDKNEEKNKELELEKLQRNLQKAKQRTMRVYRAELDTWVWEQDFEAVQEAQKELYDFYTEQQKDDIDKRIEALEKEVEALEKTTNEEEESYDKRLKLLDEQIEKAEEQIKKTDEQIKKAEEYKEEWNSVKTDYEHAQNEIVAKAQLGADAEKEILSGRLGVLNNFKTGYTQALSEVATKTKEQVESINSYLNEIKTPSFTTVKTAKDTFGSASFAASKGKYMVISTKYSPKIQTDSGRVYVDIDSQHENYIPLDEIHEVGDSYFIPSTASVYAKPYASGTLSAKSGLANVDEKGNELIIPKQGRYRMMEYGDTVVPHNLSQRLFDVASNPLRFIANALNSVKSPNLMTSSVQTSNQSIIHIGTIELPSVTNGENFIKQLQLIAANR